MLATLAADGLALDALAAAAVARLKCDHLCGLFGLALERIGWRCSGGLQGPAHQACPPLEPIWTSHVKSRARALCRSCQGWHIANGGPYVLEKIAWRCSGGLQGPAHQACPPLEPIWASLCRYIANGWKPTPQVGEESTTQWKWLTAGGRKRPHAVAGVQGAEPLGLLCGP